MTLIFSFFTFCSSTTISLTQDNFESIKELANGKPILLEFWDPWCNHCAAFKPKYAELSNISKYSDKVIFTDTNCVENKKFCTKISTSGYPQVIYFDSSRDIYIEYDGIMDIPGIEFFIHKQINFPIHFLESNEELDEFRKNTNASSLFVLKIKKLNQSFFINSSAQNDEAENHENRTNLESGDNSEIDKILNIIKDVASLNRIKATNFVSIISNNDNDFGQNDNFSFFVYKSYNKTIKYEEDWSHDSIKDFVKKNIFPSLPPITGVIFEDFKSSKQLCAVYFLNSSSQYQKMLEIVEQMNSQIQFFYMNFDKSDYFCRFIGIKEKNLPQLLVIDVAREQWCFYQSEFNAESISNWIQNFNPKEAKWKGPGIGALADFYSTFFTIWATGGWPLAVVIICFIFLLCVVVFIIFDCYRIYKEENQYRKNV